MAQTGSPGVNKLARVIQGRIARTVDTSAALPLDFGVIQVDGSLRTNTFRHPIPAGDYLRCAGCTAHAGDRVLVAWVQNDAVVVDAITG